MILIVVFSQQEEKNEMEKEKTPQNQKHHVGNAAIMTVSIKTFPYGKKERILNLGLFFVVAVFQSSNMPHVLPKKRTEIKHKKMGRIH